jgi:predicted membrane channel-forming protein YqfA (hemolysin III family)
MFSGNGSWITLILSILLFTAVTIIVFNLLRIYVFTKVKVNKWIVLAIAVLIFFMPAFLGVNLQNGVVSAVQSGLFVIFFLWFMELSGFSNKGASKRFYGKNDKNDKIKIRPKAKPNRVKNNK